MVTSPLPWAGQFQCFRIHFMKKNFLISNLNFSWHNLRPFPLILTLFFPYAVKQSFPVLFCFPLSIAQDTASALLFGSSKFSLKLNSKFMQANPSQTLICSNYHGAVSVLSYRAACLLQKYLIERKNLNISSPVKQMQSFNFSHIPTESFSFISNSPTEQTLLSTVAYIPSTTAL